MNLRYAQAFWDVVVLGCIDARNWDYCFPVDRWLVPYFEDLWRYYNEPPYSAEKEALKHADPAVRGAWPTDY